MTKLQTVHWLLLIVPLIVRWALRIWQKNLRSHINKESRDFPPVPQWANSMGNPQKKPL